MQGKYDAIKSHYKQAKAERDQQAALYSEEHAKHEGTEQKLAQTKAELAKLEAKQEDFLVVVCVYITSAGKFLKFLVLVGTAIKSTEISS